MDGDQESIGGAPGWDAIDAALRGIYGQAEPKHVGYFPPAAFSANLQGCSAYAANGHWHYVTYGLSELYEPPPEDDRLVSGWGFELTMRVARGAEPEAPPWPFTMLNELAKHVNTKRVLLEPGDRVDMRSPMTGYPRVRLRPAEPVPLGGRAAYLADQPHGLIERDIARAGRGHYLRPLRGRFLHPAHSGHSTKSGQSRSLPARSVSSPRHVNRPSAHPARPLPAALVLALMLVVVAAFWQWRRDRAAAPGLVRSAENS